MRYFLVLLLIGCASSVLAQTATTPGAIVDEIPTCNCLGFRWLITGDTDLDCSVAVDYRLAGTTAWLPAQPMLRVEPASVSGNAFDPGNLLAGSVLGLQPDTDYEVRLTLSDPDGGASVQTRNLRTRAIPADPVAPVLKYVAPGSGGGAGTQSSPYLGLAAAQAGATAGDVFILQAGTYSIPSTFTFNKSGTAGNPIVWRGVDAATVILDGAGSAQPVLTFSGSQHVHLEKVTVRNPLRTAINGTATKNLVIRECVIDCSAVSTSTEAHGVLLQGAGHEGAYISQNRIRGNIDWTGGRNQDAYACILLGRGHIIQYNEIYDWWDTAGLGGNDTTVDTSGCDIRGNDFHNVTDDGIEMDGARFNNRVLENRFTNVLCGISCQPCLAGPTYIVRNAIYNYQLKPLKFHILGNTPTGMLVYNNTFVGADPRGIGGGDWRNSHFRNNLFLASDDSGAIAFDTNAQRFSWDYNGWYHSPSASNFGRLNGTYYAIIAAFRSGMGQEAHGLLVDYTVFTSAAMPTRGGLVYPFTSGFSAPYTPGAADLTLKSGANVAVDAGVALPNVTDAAAPDLGAYERGAGVPAYGPAGFNGGTSTPSAPSAASHCTATALSGLRIRVNFADNSGNEDGFRIERSDAGGPFTTLTSLAAGVTSYEDAGLTDGVAYGYRVVAFNTVGDAAPSNTATATAVITLPAGPAVPSSSAGGGGCAGAGGATGILALLLLIAASVYASSAQRLKQA
ncbi:MAG: right-handed parallel beta-helix repeat-containing protein [Planctomycetes bacterium]|nr:right-handed parallel beta-helix repeat-containing protein [Planctomycetota bacterium]